MSETNLTLMFWLALAGLSVVIASFGGLIEIQRRKGIWQMRLARAVGTGPSRTTKADARRGGSLAHMGKQLRGVIVMMGQRLSALMGGEARETAADLSSAGYRSRDALLIYAFMKTVVPVVALVGGMGWVLLTTELGMEMMIPSAIAIAFALALSKGVDMFVDIKRKNRLALIRRGFPDMLELLVISSEAGLGPQPALQRVAKELSSISPDLAQEVLLMVSEMRMTNDRQAAYERLNTRVPLPEIGIFTQALDQSDTYGTPFARAMRTLINEQRSNRLMAVEEKAARLPVIMTIPLIFCIMPAVFVVLVGPAVLSVIDNLMS